MNPLDYQAPANLLEQRVIAVTGAGDGIGKEAALTFARHGATVILMGKTVAKLENVFDQIADENLAEAAIYPIDFFGATEPDYIDMCNRIEAAFGKLDGILFNAAELGDRTPLQNYATDTWQRLMQVNVTAPFLMCKHLLPLLRKSDDASLVFTGSSVGYKGRAYWGAYAVTKAAGENLMQTLADEEDGTSTVRANSINPGATRTKMRAKAFPAENPSTVKTPGELMPAYLYLMGRDSKHLNGSQVDASGR